MTNTAKLIGISAGLLALVSVAFGDSANYQVGVAKIDITPDYPVRLSGYAARKTESEGVAQHLFAKALAIAPEGEKPAVLITVDNCGVPGNVRDEVVRALQKKRSLAPERIAICSTHTHSAPWLKGYLPNLFIGGIPAEQQAHVERYTRELTAALQKVALEALNHLQPARLSLGKSQVGFAANRRTKGGPVDHDLPVLFVTSPEGKLRAVFANYACHCTTLTGEFNQICGDWAGYAQEAIEAEHPGAIALIALGCAGDANPHPRPGWDLAKQHGREIANAVGELLVNHQIHVEGKLSCITTQIDLPFAPLPTRAEWEAKAKQNDYVGYQARLNLERLDRGEKLPETLRYMVQGWSFGKSLAMVFLPGEVVVDYSLRLKREFDPSRLWINAYANDVPCYIPSERVLKEGGYEGGFAMVYYDKPAPFAPGIEDRIISAVHAVVPPQFEQAAAASQPSR